MIWLLFGYGCTQNLPYNALFDGLPQAQSYLPNPRYGNSLWVLLPTAEVEPLFL